MLEDVTFAHPSGFLRAKELFFNLGNRWMITMKLFPIYYELESQIGCILTETEDVKTVSGMYAYPLPIVTEESSQNNNTMVLKRTWVALAS